MEKRRYYFVYIEDYKEASREVEQDALEEFNFFGDDITKEGKEQQDTYNCGATIASESKSNGSTCYTGNSGITVGRKQVGASTGQLVLVG